MLVMTLRLPDLRAAMDEALTRQVATGAALYDRNRHLAPLIGDWRHMTDAEIIARLEVKLRAMQRLMLATDHYAGDINRVIALKQALAGEKRNDDP
jgi:hypothetical protein